MSRSGSWLTATQLWQVLIPLLILVLILAAVTGCSGIQWHGEASGSACYGEGRDGCESEEEEQEPDPYSIPVKE